MISGITGMFMGDLDMLLYKAPFHQVVMYNMVQDQAAI
jgi:hypothetical protein